MHNPIFDLIIKRNPTKQYITHQLIFPQLKNERRKNPTLFLPYCTAPNIGQRGLQFTPNKIIRHNDTSAEATKLHLNKTSGNSSINKILIRPASLFQNVKKHKPLKKEGTGTLPPTTYTHIATTFTLKDQQCTLV
jgi:hypothetical protein